MIPLEIQYVAADFNHDMLDVAGMVGSIHGFLTGFVLPVLVLRCLQEKWPQCHAQVDGPFCTTHQHGERA